MMSHHLDLVRSGVASIEEELQQRASLLAVDNANLRTILEQTNGELHTLRGRLSEFDVSQKKLVKMQQQILASDKENKTLKQTLKYLQSELVKSGKKMPNLASVGGAMGGGGMPPPKPPPPSLPP
jgi:predicted RNase H-like nuclease (RuvC/YqgF family)